MTDLKKHTDVIIEHLRTHGFRSEVSGPARRGVLDTKSIIILTEAPPQSVGLLFKQTNRRETQPLTTRFVTGGGIPVFIISVPEQRWGSYQIFYTGPPAFRRALCVEAKFQGYKLNVKGLWLGRELIGGIDEASIFRVLALGYVPPENRTAFISERRKELLVENAKRRLEKSKKSTRPLPRNSQRNRGKPSTGQ